MDEHIDMWCIFCSSFINLISQGMKTDSELLLSRFVPIKAEQCVFFLGGIFADLPTERCRLSVQKASYNSRVLMLANRLQDKEAICHNTKCASSTIVFRCLPIPSAERSARIGMKGEYYSVRLFSCLWDNCMVIL